ncbi:hypothetical protein FOZ60_003739 [Perkinsus olseni]|uniref:U1-type domain-containing protein n=1 Tax=Perkinsus olseni TaxID=32597 RepID=A0A7J6PHR7_PEROL|nr:hypothetical protein FOZ60_003739 [Perkinsus olseni]
MLSSHPPSSSVTTADQLVARTIELSPFQPASVSAAANTGGRVLLTSPEQREAAPRWEEHPCDLCKCVLYSAEELRNHVNGKRHQKALRNRDWFKAQEEKRLATVNEHEVFLASSSHSNINENTNRAVVNDKEGESIGLVIFEDHTIWEETNTGWRCKLCDAAVNSDSMGMAHMSSRKHQTNLAWASTTSAATSSAHQNNNPGAAVDNQWRAGSYDEDTQFHNECTYQFYGNRDKPGLLPATRPAHNDWMDCRCKLCQTGDICGWGAWSAHFNGKAHKKNVRMSKYEYQAVWQKLNAEGFEYYYDHLTGLWDSTNPVEDEIEAFPEDGILYIRDPPTLVEE